METIKGKIVCFCISFLAISSSGGNLGASASILPFYPYGVSLPDDCNYPGTSLIPGDNTAAEKQRLINQASILLRQLSSTGSSGSSVNIDKPCNCAADQQEKILLQNLVNRLESLKKSSAVAPTPSTGPPAISKATNSSITKQHDKVRVLASKLLSPSDAKVVQSALDDLYETFHKIISGQLLNAELPNLCSKTLALNTQLTATDAPTELQDASTDFMKLLTLALTGQSQVTILGLCDCLNDLETSVVTVVANDESQTLQFLLSSLVDAVTRAVISGGDVGSNVIEVVKRYATSIKQAIQEDDHARAGKIYNSVLNFEEELYKVLITPADPAAITTTPRSDIVNPSDPKTEKDYLREIGELSKKTFGNGIDLVRSAVQILLGITNSEHPGQSISTGSKKTTLENLKKVVNLLISVSSGPQPDSSHAIEVLVQLLSTFPKTDTSKVLDALNPTLKDDSDVDPLDDATAIVSDGERFVLTRVLVPQTDDDGNVIDVLQSGKFQLVDPNTNISWSGSYVINEETIQTDPNGNVVAKRYGLYDVDLPANPSSSSGAPRVRRRGNFELQDYVVVQVGENGHPSVREHGTYVLSDSSAGTTKSGGYVVENNISRENPDGSVEVFKSGILSADEADGKLPSGKPSPDDSIGYFLFSDHIFASPDKNGNLGNGSYNIRIEDPKNSDITEHQSGSYVIQQTDIIVNPDGSMDSTTDVLIYVNDPKSDPANSDLTPFIVNGSQFRFEDHLISVTDEYGHVSPMSVGNFTVTHPGTGKVNSGRYAIYSSIVTRNSDGSQERTKFGEIYSVVVNSPITKLPTTPRSSSDPTKGARNPVNRPPISKDSFASLIDKLNPTKPARSGTGVSKKPSPSTIKGTNTYSGATSIVSDGASFIIAEVITPLLDPSGNVIGQIVMGTYHLMNNRTNVSWSGAFEVEDSSLTSTSPSLVELTASGTFDLVPTDADSDSVVIGEFSITDQLVTIISQNGTALSSERGTFRLTDSTTGDSKSGTFVVENTVSRSQPGGAIELIKSGFLFVDDPDFGILSPYKKPLIPGYDGYFLFDDYIFDESDSDGNQGNGVYSVKDTVTNEYATGTYVIQEASIKNNPDGSTDSIIRGVIEVDGFDPISNTGSSASPSIIKNGARFVINEHLDFVTDPYGHASWIGNGKYTQIDPKTGVRRSESYVFMNVVSTPGDDGSSRRVQKFGVLSIDDDDSRTTPAPSIKNPHKPLVLRSDSLKTLVNSLNPVQTPGVKPHSTSTIGNPIYDATAIVTDGSLFVIDGKVVTQQDDDGNVVGLIKTGSYSIRDPSTNIIWTGSFEVDEFSIESTAVEGQTLITALGAFDVIRPTDSSDPTTVTKNQANFSIQDLLTVVVDETGVSSTSEEGTYSLDDPVTGASTSGKFIVRNRLSTRNPDGSIDIVKSGVLQVDDGFQSAPADESDIKYGGYFLTNQHLLSDPDDNGNYGFGSYQIKDGSTNEYRSGTYRILDASSVENFDGTQTVTTSGLIFVDSSRSSSTSTNTDPSLAIIDGANFKFVDHLSTATDVYGRVIIVGTGEFTQTDPRSNTRRSGKYIIQDIVNTDNPDGSQDVIETRRFYCTTDDPSCGDSFPTTIKSPGGSAPSPTKNVRSDKTSSDPKMTLETLISYLGALKSQINQLPTENHQQPSPEKSETNPVDDSHTENAPNSVKLPLANVVSANSGQCVALGDVVVVYASNGVTLVATIKDSYSSVTFNVTNSADLNRIFLTAKKVWVVLENDFSKQDRRLFDAAATPTNPPCKT